MSCGIFNSSQNNIVSWCEIGSGYGSEIGHYEFIINLKNYNMLFTI